MKHTGVPISLDNAAKTECQAEIIHQKQLYAVQQKAADDHRTLISVYTDREKKLKQELNQAFQLLVDKELAFKNLYKINSEKHQAELAQLLHALSQFEGNVSGKSTDDKASITCENHEFWVEKFEKLTALLQEHDQREKMLLVDQSNLLNQLANREKEFCEEARTVWRNSEQDKFDLIRAYTKKTEELQQKFSHDKTELLQTQLAMQVRSAEREREHSEQLELFHQLAEQEKQTLNQRFADQLLTAEQQYAAREKELLQEQLAMQVRSTEREREFSEQLKILFQRTEQEKAELSHQLKTIHIAYERNVTILHTTNNIVVEISNYIKKLHSSWWWFLTQPFGLYQSILDNLTNLLEVCNTVSIITTPITGKIDDNNKSNNAHIETYVFDSPDNNKIIHEVGNIVMNLEQILLQCGDDFIRSAYRSILGREVDISGLLHFKNKLRQGCGKEFVLVDLYNSQESKSRLSHSDLSSAPDEYFIEKIYERILHRPVDQVGKTHYLNMLKKSGERQRIIDDIERSVEAKEKNANVYLLREQLAKLTKEIKKRRGLFAWWEKNRRIDHHFNRIEYLIEESNVNLSQQFDCMLTTVNSQLLLISSQQEKLLLGVENLQTNAHQTRPAESVVSVQAPNVEAFIDNYNTTNDSLYTQLLNHVAKWLPTGRIENV